VPRHAHPGRAAAGLALAAALLAGCSGPDSGATAVPGGPAIPGGPSAPGGAPAAAPGPYPLTVDNCGQKLTLDRPPTRVVALDQVAAENLLQLGLARVLVGTAAADDAVFPTVAAAYRAVPVRAGRDALTAARPDIVVGDLDTDSYGGAHYSRSELAERGIRGFTLRCGDEAPDPARVFSRYVELGRIFGVADRAEATVKEVQAALGRTAQAVGDVGPVDTFVHRSGTGPLVTAGGAGEPDFGLRLAGGRNVFGDRTDQASPEVDAAAVVAADPAVVVAAAADRPFLTRALAGTRAVRAGRFCPLDRYAFGTPVRLARDVNRLAACLHPAARIPAAPPIR
jgi:iron complex transport system substrate-binding protein